MSMLLRTTIGLGLASILLLCRDLPAQSPDHSSLRTLNSHFPFQPPDSLAAWQNQAEQIRLRTQVALGLWPAPRMAEPKPQIYGKLIQTGFSVEKIIFETLPGFWFTGSLYRPDPLPENAMPGILCPHGHWADGRFHDAGDRAVREQLAIGAERFEAAAHNPIQARCVQLARMGCTVIQSDMLGYADSRQFDYGRMHGNRRTENSPPPINEAGWLLLSPPAESHLQSIAGLQTINSLQAMEVLKQLPGVDRQRLAVTGASGGGTQTFLLTAVSSEVAASFPAVMVSTGMQGGCTCENVCFLRIGQGNVHLAALAAPRPLGMTAANDWTKTMPEDGFPQLQQVYELFGRKNQVRLAANLHFGHNYNHVSRTAMYGWVNEFFQLGLQMPVLESDYQRLTREDLSVWDSEHPLPPSGPDFERRFLADWKTNNDARLQELLQKESGDGVGGFSTLVRTAAKVLIGTDVSPPTATENHEEIQGFREWKTPFGVPVRTRRFVADSPTAPWVVLTSGRGMSGLVVDGRLLPSWEPIVQAGFSVLAVEMEGQSPDQKPQALLENERSAAYTFGYNLPQVSKHAGTLLAVMKTLRAAPNKPQIYLVADQGATPAAALAIGTAPTDLTGACLEPNGFRFESVSSLSDPHFLPGGARYGDLPGFLAAAAPLPLLVMGESLEKLPFVRSLYAAHQATANFSAEPRPKTDYSDRVLDWLKMQNR